MHTGWIKLYRCLLDDPVWQCSTNEQKVILITLLLMANHAEKKWQWQGKPYICKPGQMITSLKSIQQKCGKGISERNIRTALKRFENLGFLTNQSTTHNRLITICKWMDYQDTTQPDDKRADSHLTNACQTPDSRPTLNKNIKNIKNEKKGTPPASFPLSFEQQDIHRARAANAEAMAAFMDHDIESSQRL